LTGLHWNKECTRCTASLELALGRPVAQGIRTQSERQGLSVFGIKRESSLHTGKQAHSSPRPIFQRGGARTSQRCSSWLRRPLAVPGDSPSGYPMPPCCVQLPAGSGNCQLPACSMSPNKPVGTVLPRRRTCDSSGVHGCVSCLLGTRRCTAGVSAPMASAGASSRRKESLASSELRLLLLRMSCAAARTRGRPAARGRAMMPRAGTTPQHRAQSAG